ncbi:hypothetical protein GCM10020358_57970 [Amorphoplanes nipponensis]|uniref:Uncharacterized protein n=1 Tax=Actinoplanes nipponensis TaxID=135950 RepID=A0A919JNL1_9ACTN|nr:hypothetical protein [Actinoplanes nipponensis]GIE52500.1 hypothetical protein Ani05nite_60340 [Actinoplanes nipponensis]
MSPPKLCPVCRANPVAFTNPRVDFCYQCLPGGPFTPPPCRACTAADGYYSAGLCGRCHPAAPQHVTSCKHCLGWGVTRHTKYLCWGCVNWRTKNTYGTCTGCRRHLPVDERRFCRLCWRQAAMLRWSRTGLSLAEANKDGQQLFIANMFSTPLAARGSASRTPIAVEPRARSTAAPIRPVDHEQLVLFDARRSLRPGIVLPPPPDPHAAQALTDLLEDHAAQRGWSPSTCKKARSGLNAVLGLQDTPGARIKTSLIRDLGPTGRATRLLREFLAGIDMLDDDLTPALKTWFAGKVIDLPAQMRAELQVWFDVLFHGHKTSAPRSRARNHGTIRYKLNAALPTLHTWAGDGYESLREITRQHVLDAIAAADEGRPRYLTGSALRSIFHTLKGHKVVFRDPTLHIKLGAPHTRGPEPADFDVIRDALNSPDPTRAALAALLAFHALTPGQLRNLTTTDIRDRRLHLDGRVIPLAEPVLIRLAAYLDYRTATWPNTANPHLFIHRRTALELKPVGGRWLGLQLGTAARGIRTDRILNEVIATGGDIKRICILFGLTPAGAVLYTAALSHPELDPGPRQG